MKPVPMYYLVLVLMGVAWGAVFPLSKIAVSTGYEPFGILVWQMLVGLLLAGILTVLRGRRLTLAPRYFILFLGVSLLGTVVPNWFSITAASELPAGVISVVIALVPLFSMPIALMLGFEMLSVIRLFGTLCGAVAVFLLIGPDASLPEGTRVIFVLVAAVAPFLYACEGNFLTWYGARGLDALQILFGASVIGLALAIPLALGSGQFISPLHPWGAADWAILAASVINWSAYAGYVWLIGKAGPVFSAQVGYLVTLFGVLISMVFLGESYSWYVWLAMGLMLFGIFLVQPRDKAA